MINLVARAVVPTPDLKLQVNLKLLPEPTFFSSSSFVAKILNVETWEFVVELKVPSFNSYPFSLGLTGIQRTPVICLEMPDKVHLITWSSNAYTFSEVGVILAAVDKFV